MSLDVYVTPLWRFKSGSLETATNRVFGPKSAISNIVGLFRRKTRLTQEERRKAIEEVEALKSTIEDELGFRPEWHDDGETVFAAQASWGFEALRCYAKWLDFRDVFERFEDPSNGNYHNHPVFTVEARDRTLRFPHIVNHNCCSGYYLPSRFDSIICVEPYQIRSWAFHKTVGSTHTLSEQLTQLRDELPDKLGPDCPVSTESAVRVDQGYSMLKRLCDASLEHQLPIVFWS